MCLPTLGSMLQASRVLCRGQLSDRKSWFDCRILRPLSPREVRNQEAVPCLVNDFYLKPHKVSLVSLGPLVSAQAFTVAPTVHGPHSPIQIGKVGENDSVSHSVQHLGKETLVSYQPGMSASCLGVQGWHQEGASCGLEVFSRSQKQWQEQELWGNAVN